MANSNGWGDGAANNAIGWGKGSDNAIGWGSVYSVSSAGLTDIVGVAPVDADAQAFITAAAITDPTQQAAINTLVVDLKGYNVWTKMKGLYPMVGGTSSSHKFNLKNPLDTDVAFRLVFNGGWTHSSTGALPNGTNAFADSFVNVGTHLALNSTHVSVYSRTNVDVLSPSIGNTAGGVPDEVSMWLRFGNTSYLRVNNATASTTASTDSRGLFIGNRNSSTQINLSIRGTQTTFSNTSNSTSTTSIKLGGLSTFFDTKQLAFSSIGDGLTSQNMTDLTTAVQAFQTTLGRSIGTQTVSDADAQAFVTAANIVDQVEANAINNLVIGMKADGIWTKMKAVYPFVGGTSSTHKFNLKDPRDLDAAYRLVFNGGWTHSSTGATPNGTNGYADTFLTPSTSLSLNSAHLSYYSRTNIASSQCEMGALSVGSQGIYLLYNYAGVGYSAFNSVEGIRTSAANPTTGLLIGSRVSSTQEKYYTNNVSQTRVQNSSSLTSNKIFLGTYNFNGFAAALWSTKQCAFASIGDGLTDTEAANLYTRVQNLNTALARQV